MGRLGEFWRRLRFRLRRDELDRELEEEIRFHLDMRIAENMAAGMSAEAARREALLRFGNLTLTREEARAMWGFAMFEDFWHDVRFGLRMLWKNPAFTAVAVLSLALGIGACTAIFSIVDAVLLRSLPYPAPDRLVQLREVNEKGARMAFAEPNFHDVRSRNRSFDGVAQFTGGLVTVLGGSQPVRARVLYASADFFRVMGVAPMVGRAFHPEESAAGRPVAVVSYGFWQRLLGSRPDFGEVTLRVDDATCAVIGVMPQGFSFPREIDIWVPREILPAQTSRTGHNWAVVARVRSDVSLDQASADLSAIARQLKQEHGEDMDSVDMALIPLQESMVSSVRQGLLIVLAAGGFLLLVACTNVANLLLAQVTARQKESALRVALGASRLRLARQFITENVLLVLGAGVLGAAMSVWAVRLLVGLNRRALPRADEIGVDLRALLFTFGLSLLIAVVLGLIPVLRLSKAGLQGDLKEAGRGLSSHAAGKRLRGAFVVAQMAFTLLLLVGAGLLGKSFLRLLEVDPGFNPENKLVMDLSVPQPPDDPGYYKRVIQFFNDLRAGRPIEEVFEDPAKHGRYRAFHQQLLERAASLPGVTAVGTINILPMAGEGSSGTFWVENSQAVTGYAVYRTATAGYFEAMGIPLVRGRLFEASDRPETRHVAVINQAMASRTWPNEDPIGKRIQFGNMDGDTRLIEIVGIVGDVREYGLDADIRSMVYANAMQRPPSSGLSLVVRASGDAAALAPALRQAAQDLNPDLPVNFRTVEQIFSSSLDGRRFSLVIFAVFAAVALLLAAIGIYGVMSYSVSQRTQEIGVRMALGAEARDVLRMIVGQGLKLALIGVALGFVAAFALTRLMASLLYGVSATDPATFAATALGLTLVALLACYVPGRRATKVDPMTALRYE